MFQFPAFATLPLCIQGKLPIIDTRKPQQHQRNLEEIVAPTRPQRDRAGLLL